MLPSFPLKLGYHQHDQLARWVLSGLTSYYYRLKLGALLILSSWKQYLRLYPIDYWFNFPEMLRLSLFERDW